MATDTDKKTTLDQKRARHAWDVIQRVVKEPESVRKDFGTQAKKLPARIMAAGLGQALAFLEAKGKTALLLEALAAWIHERRHTAGDRRLVVRIIEGDADFLRYATAESLAYLQWLVRFAEAHNVTDATEG
jgi:CRISPR-associated protein Cmr5